MKSKYKAIIYIILSAFSFAFMFAFVRLSGDLPTVQKTFFRNFVALFFAIGVLKKNHIRFHIEGKKNNAVIFVRALAGTLGMLGNFYAIDHLVLSDASMLNKMSPFFVIIFSFIFLKERLTFFQGFTVICAFIGSLFIIKPSFQNVDFFPALIGFLGGMGAGTCLRLRKILRTAWSKWCGDSCILLGIFLLVHPAISNIRFPPYDDFPNTLFIGSWRRCGRRTVRYNCGLHSRSCKGDIGL